MSKLIYTDSPTEQDFPLIDRCVVCDGVCYWQPRYEIAARTDEHKAVLNGQGRPFDYVPEYRVVKICADCGPDDNDELRDLIRKLYPVFAKREGI